MYCLTGIRAEFSNVDIMEPEVSEVKHIDMSPLYEILRSAVPSFLSDVLLPEFDALPSNESRVFILVSFFHIFAFNAPEIIMEYRKALDSIGFIEALSIKSINAKKPPDYAIYNAEVQISKALARLRPEMMLDKRGALYLKMYSRCPAPLFAGVSTEGERIRALIGFSSEVPAPDNEQYLQILGMLGYTGDCHTIQAIVEQGVDPTVLDLVENEISSLLEQLWRYKPTNPDQGV